MRRVLIVSPHFPPDSSAGAHRARLLAPHLASFGWTPTIVTVTPDAYDARLDHELASRVPPALDVVRVPAWPVSATRRIGVGDLGLRALWPLRQRCAELCTRERYDVTYITIYPTYPSVLGPWLKRRFGTRFVLDLQDPWVGSWGAQTGPGGAPDLRSRVSRALAVRLERRIVPAADGLTSVSHGTLNELAARVPHAATIPREELPIGWDAGDVAHAHHTLPSEPHRPWTAVYLGALLPAGRDVLRAFFRGFAEWRRADAGAARRLRFVGTSNQSTGLLHTQATALADEEGVASDLDESPSRVPFFDGWREQVSADLVLVLGTSEPHYTASKVFGALLSGRPVLAIVHTRSTVATLIRSAPPASGIELIEIDGAFDVSRLAKQVARRLNTLGALGRGVTVQFDPSVLESSRADRLAARLAGLFDRVCAGAAAA
ncbi:MAG TPA: glycosyltransferase [Vicinamibacterales bacterium]|nr:glycosyltransferase [Vicinamibacterales bacterium]